MSSERNRYDGLVDYFRVQPVNAGGLRTLAFGIVEQALKDSTDTGLTAGECQTLAECLEAATVSDDMAVTD